MVLLVIRGYVIGRDKWRIFDFRNIEAHYKINFKIFSHYRKKENTL